MSSSSVPFLSATGAADAYRPPGGAFDEAIAADGARRSSWEATLRAVGPLSISDLHERQRNAERLLDAEGAGHLVHEMSLDRLAVHHDRSTERQHVPLTARADSRPWRLDPLPFMLEAAEFTMLSQGAVQRMRLLDAVLNDSVGDQVLVREGIAPSGLMQSLAAYRSAGDRFQPTRWLTHYAIDIARDATGTWRVVHDLTDAPSGLGYSLLNRSVLARLAPDGLQAAGVAPISTHADHLRRALTAAAPNDRPSPRVVVLSAGPTHPSYIEHSYLAARLGYHIVEGADLVMREGRLWLRALDGLEPIDVVYRRMEDASLDPLERDHSGASGVPGLVWGARGGKVVLANAYGSGLGESHDLWPYLGAASQRLLGESLLLDHLAPGAQLASTPVFTGAASIPLESRGVVLRLNVVNGPDGHVVMPGGSGRVLAAGDDPQHPTARISKDVWVVGIEVTRPLVISAPPQVDFGPSVPKRAADSLYWLGRAAERAEVAARTARVVAVQLDQDPLLTAIGNGAWALGVESLLAAARNETITTRDASITGVSTRDRLVAALDSTVRVTAAQLTALVQEASSVREFLSAGTGRVLGRLAAAHLRLADVHADSSSDELDTVLIDLAALSGLAMESTVRGPAWRFLDLGRRIERAVGVLGAVEAALGVGGAAMALQPLSEALLGSNESLVAYRRRYRSDVEFDAVLDLLLRDDANPRGLAYQLDRLREHVAALSWTEGVNLVHEASVAALAAISDVEAGGRRIGVDGYVLGVRGPLLNLADAIVQRWFADPVNPTLLGGI